MTARASAASQVDTSFPHSLKKMVEEADDDVIGWSECGEWVVVRDHAKLEQSVLQIFFKRMKRLVTLKNQLKAHNFVKDDQQVSYAVQ